MRKKIYRPINLKNARLVRPCFRLICPYIPAYFIVSHNSRHVSHFNAVMDDGEGENKPPRTNKPPVLNRRV